MASKEVDYPTGIIPRIEKQTNHIEFLKGNDYIDWIMIDITVAETIINQGFDSQSFFKLLNPNLKVITTTTINDEKLLKYHREYETNIIYKFKPDYHIPCDCPVYIEGKKTIRYEIIENYYNDVLILKKDLDEIGVNIIPLFKAITKEEKKICYRLFTNLKTDYISYYAAQYGGSGGMKINELNNEIRDVISDTNVDKVMVIGQQSPRILKKFPPEVIAATGQRWRKASKLGKISIDKSQKKFGKWKAKVEKKHLNCGDSIIEKYQGG